MKSWKLKEKFVELNFADINKCVKIILHNFIDNIYINKFNNIYFSYIFSLNVHVFLVKRNFFAS